MTSQKGKISVPKDIEDELSLFVSINKDYYKTKIPLNLIDPDLTLNETLFLYDFLVFKLDCSNELDFNEDEVLELENFKNAYEDLLKIDSFIKLYEDNREGIKKFNKEIATLDYKLILGLFMKALLNYQEAITTTLEYVSEWRKELISQITDEEIEKSTEEKIGLLKILNSENEGLFNKEIIRCYSAPYSLRIYSYISSIIRQSNKYTETSVQIIKNLVILLDQQLYYTYALLNCQKSLLKCEKELYEFLLDPHSGGLYTSMNKNQFSSTIKIYYISEVYKDLFLKYKSTISPILKEINKLIDENE